MAIAMRIFLTFALLASAAAFAPAAHPTKTTALNFFNFGGAPSKGAASTVPTTPAKRDAAAIASVKSAIDKPRTKSFPLIEVEFPPLAALNKLGDGSLRSSNEAEAANVDFCVKLGKALGGPMGGSKVVLLVGSAASGSFLGKAQKKAGGGIAVQSLRKDGPPDMEGGSGTVYVLVAPSQSSDYKLAAALASSKSAAKAVVIVNGFAKDNFSVSTEATMAYFYKALTYNSQISGYLVRGYPGAWTAVDAATKEVLGTFDDETILVPRTNTPDLRGAVSLASKAFDRRAIAAREKAGL